MDTHTKEHRDKVLWLQYFKAVIKCWLKNKVSASGRSKTREYCGLYFLNKNNWLKIGNCDQLLRTLQAVLNSVNKVNY